MFVLCHAPARHFYFLLRLFGGMFFAHQLQGRGGGGRGALNSVQLCYVPRYKSWPAPSKLVKIFPWYHSTTLVACSSGLRGRHTTRNLGRATARDTLHGSPPLFYAQTALPPSPRVQRVLARAIILVTHLAVAIRNGSDDRNCVVLLCVADFYTTEAQQPVSLSSCQLGYSIAARSRWVRWREQNTTPLQHSLDRHLVEMRLSKSLQNPRRPSKKDLVDHGLYIDATPRELQMDVSTRSVLFALRLLVAWSIFFVDVRQNRE